MRSERHIQRRYRPSTAHTLSPRILKNSIRLCAGLSSDPGCVYRFARGKKARQSATYDSDSAAKRRQPHNITDGRAQIMISSGRQRADTAFCRFSRASLIKITPVTPFCAK